jgi:hypothetical protein
MKERSAADRARQVKVGRTSAERVLSENRTRWSKAELQAIDQFIAQQDSPEIPTRAEAIRRLVRMGLKARAGRT